MLLYGAFICHHFSGYDDWLPDPTNCSISALFRDSSCGYKYNGKLGHLSDQPLTWWQRHCPTCSLCYHMTNHIIAWSPWKLQSQYSSLSVHALNPLFVHTKENCSFPPLPHSAEFLFSYSVYCFSDVMKPTQIT